jgi:hypothetical protein
VGPALHDEGGSRPRSINSLLIRLRAIAVRLARRLEVDAVRRVENDRDRTKSQKIVVEMDV